MKKSENEACPTIPYYVHEGELARMERINRRVSVLCGVLALLLPVSFAVGRAAWK